ncbi:hypothetical protein [Mycolicibacterium sp. XJ1819]
MASINAFIGVANSVDGVAAGTAWTLPVAAAHPARMAHAAAGAAAAIAPPRKRRTTAATGRSVDRGTI